jgi:glycosyltransferase involved in cell wall biosynthesis
MNFLFLNSAHVWGGNEKWTLMAAEALSEDHNVCLAYRKNEVGGRFKIEKFKLPFLSELDFVTILKLLLLIRKKNIDILIPTKPKEYFIAGIASKLSGKRNILRLGIMRFLGNSFINNLVYNKLADGIIVNAASIKQTLLKSGFMQSDRIEIIYNGLDRDKLDKYSNNNLILPERYNFIITTMGLLTKRKRIDILIKGFAEFIKLSKTAKAQLFIIGDGEELENLKKLAIKLNVSDFITFTGFVENPYPYLQAGDVFVMTSNNEGISNALLEAMYLKNAVISAYAGGVDEIINSGENGILLHDEEINQLGKSLYQLYADQDKIRKMAEAAKRTVDESFLMEKMKMKMINFCQRICKPD